MKNKKKRLRGRRGKRDKKKRDFARTHAWKGSIPVPIKIPRGLSIEEEKFLRDWRFLWSKEMKFFVLFTVLALAFAIRFTPSRLMETRMFLGQDHFWHLHVVNEIVRLGYRPEVDTYSWVPLGQPLVHPPVYHYLIFGISRLLPFLSALDVMLYVGPFVGLLGAFAWFLLCKELYGGWFEG